MAEVKFFVGDVDNRLTLVQKLNKLVATVDTGGGGGGSGYIEIDGGNASTAFDAGELNGGSA